MMRPYTLVACPAAGVAVTGEFVLAFTRAALTRGGAAWTSRQGTGQQARLGPASVVWLESGAQVGAQTREHIWRRPEHSEQAHLRPVSAA